MDKVSKTHKDDFPDLFWEGLSVRKVSFSEEKITGYGQDTITNSTILKGEVRIGNQVVKLQADQFLLFSEEPGIRKLRFIRIHPNSPKGLQVIFSGRSKAIEVGLHPQFPVQSIKPSWLSQFFSPEAVNAIVTFISAVTAIFLPRLIPESPKINKNP